MSLSLRSLGRGSGTDRAWLCTRFCHSGKQCMLCDDDANERLLHSDTGQVKRLVQDVCKIDAFRGLRNHESWS